jgi:ATP-dependent Zn protease
MILVSFDDIAGIDEKANSKKLFSLKEPERYTLVGAKDTKGDCIRDLRVLENIIS